MNNKLETKQIFLKKLTMRDRENFFKAFNSKYMTKYLSIPYPLTKTWIRNYIDNALEQFKNKTKYTWGIFSKKSETFLGVAVIKGIDTTNKTAQLGYAIKNKYWNKGLTFICVNLLLKYSFLDLDLNRVEIRVDIENDKSIQFANKLGAIKEGIIRETLFHDGKFHDLYLYSILKKEYFEKYPHLKESSHQISG